MPCGLSKGGNMSKMGIYRCYLCGNTFEDEEIKSEHDLDQTDKHSKIFHVCRPDENDNIEGLGKLVGRIRKESKEKR